MPVTNKNFKSSITLVETGDRKGVDSGDIVLWEDRYYLVQEVHQAENRLIFQIFMELIDRPLRDDELMDAIIL